MSSKLTKQLQGVQVERDELAVAERALKCRPSRPRPRLSLRYPVKAAGRAVLLIPHGSEVSDEEALPVDYRKIPAIVRDGDGPVQVRAAGGRLGLEPRCTASWNRWGRR
ncbi:hypothetical protein [Streptomyces griseorubiginosus]|uniref:hypothetical protein n=1 Tax=Streptomyces griseorubiginosus TaxID=67304 RepID=UPI003646A0BC